MIKSIVLLLSIFFCMLSQATPQFVLTYERFLLMSNEQQNEVLIKMMETIVELEQNHLSLKRPRSVNSNHEELKKLKDLYLKLQSLIISEAYAEVARDTFITFADEFNKALNETGSTDKCIYAGWVSRMKQVTVTENGRSTTKSYCVHPKRLDQKDPLSISYQKVAGKCQNDQIACQPAIFGFKINSNPICVKVEVFDEIQNASAACKTEATKNPDSDEFKQRFENLKTLLAEGHQSNNKALETMYGNLAKACLCQDGIKTLNVDYKKYMQPHQTCYGLLSTLKKVHAKDECLPPALASKEEFKFLETIKENLTYREADPQDPNKLAKPWEDYQIFIKEFSIANFCQEPTPVKDLICEAECRIKNDKIECKFIDPETKKEIIPEEPPVLKAGEEIQVVEKQTKRVTKCKIAVKEEPKKSVYTCVPQCKASSANTKELDCQLKVKKDDKLDETLKLEPAVYKGASDKEIVVEAILKLENSTEKLNCNIPAQVKDQKCIGKCEQKDTKVICNELSILEDGKSLPGVTFQQLEFAESLVIDKKVSVEYKLGQNIQKITCELEISSPANNGPEKPKLSLKLKIDETTATSRTVSALINDKAEIPADHEIQWTRKNIGSLKFEAEPAGKTTVIPDNNGSSQAEEKVSTAVVSKGIKTTQPRKSAVYKICASLIDKEKNSVGEECEDIPAAEPKAPTPIGNGRNLPPPPPIQQRQGIGTGYGGAL